MYVYAHVANLRYSIPLMSLPPDWASFETRHVTIAME